MSHFGNYAMFTNNFEARETKCFRFQYNIETKLNECQFLNFQIHSIALNFIAKTRCAESFQNVKHGL